MFIRILFWFLIFSMTSRAVAYYGTSNFSPITFAILMVCVLYAMLPFLLQTGNTFFGWVWRSDNIDRWLTIPVGTSGILSAYINSIMYSQSEFLWSFILNASLLLFGFFFLNKLTEKYTKEIAVAK